MPFVEIKAIKNLIKDKSKLYKGITKVFEDLGINPDWVQIRLIEVEPEDWSKGPKSIAEIGKEGGKK